MHDHSEDLIIDSFCWDPYIDDSMIQNFEEEEAQRKDVNTHHLYLLDEESVLRNRRDPHSVLDSFQSFDDCQIVDSEDDWEEDIDRKINSHAQWWSLCWVGHEPEDNEVVQDHARENSS